MSAENNVVVASFATGNTVQTRPLYQWDYGQVLQFDGVTLPEAHTVHFSNWFGIGCAKTQIGHADGVVIPDEYLITGLPVYAWVYLNTGAADGETVYAVTIPVIKRPKPVEDAPTPAQEGLIETAIAALNQGVSEVEAAKADFDAKFPPPPTTNGSYWLGCQVTNNGVEYFWDIPVGV